MLENLAMIGLAGFGALTLISAFSLIVWLFLWTVTIPFAGEFLDRYGRETEEILLRGRQNGIDGRRRDIRHRRLIALRKVLKFAAKE